MKDKEMREEKKMKLVMALYYEVQVLNTYGFSTRLNAKSQASSIVVSQLVNIFCTSPMLQQHNISLKKGK